MVFPVTFVTGFLGAGKTTLIQQLIRAGALRDALVVVNDFGDLSIDQQILNQGDQEVIELGGGCVCCSVRDEFVTTLKTAVAAQPQMTSVWIETSGISAPSELLAVFEANAWLTRGFRVERVVTVVECSHALADLSERDNAIDQVVYASTLLLNRASRVTLETLDAISERLSQLNPWAQQHRIEVTEVTMNHLGSAMDYGDHSRIQELQAKLAPCGHVHAPGEACAGHHPVSATTHGVSTHLARTTTPLRTELFSAALEAWIVAQGDRLLRIKGVLSFDDEPVPMVLQGIRGQVSVEPLESATWPSGESTIVAIGVNLDYEALDAVVAS
ncbi:MAG: GTP-binding protein [Gammaproteobacteria bacterium]|nr:GTP-binding protein [Gammaproteobacteria bacterium]